MEALNTSRVLYVFQVLWITLAACLTKKNWGGPINWIKGRKSEAAVRRYSVKKNVLKNCAKFTGKLWHSCFPVNFANFFTAPFLYNTSGKTVNARFT